MIEIRTRDDVLYWQDTDPEFLEEVRKAVSLEHTFHLLDRFAGYEIGHTQETYDRFQAERHHLASECRTCSGSGTVTPKARSVGTIHPSGANTCVLRLYNDVMAIKRPRSVKPQGLRTTFDFGHITHARVQSALLAAANWNEEAEIQRLALEPWDPWMNDVTGITSKLAPLEFEFEDEVRVELPAALISGGHADGVFEMTVEVRGELVRVRGILEIKTSGEEDYKKIKKPKDDHRIQAAALYATALDCAFVVFLYFAKVFDMKQIFVREFVDIYDRALYEKWCTEKLDKVEHALETGRPPTADAGSWECGQCNYNNDCPQKRGFAGGQQVGKKLRR